MSFNSIASIDKGGFALSATRVIYDESKKEANIDVINSSQSVSFLVQSWLSNYDTNKVEKGAFIITPPLYRQDKGKNTLRILRSENLATDRETAYWLNVKAIPAQDKDAKNVVAIAYVMRIKLFYRPANLNGDASSAYKSLTFSKQGDEIVVKNPTPYFITLNELRVGGKGVKDVSAMVAPLSEQRYQSPVNTQEKTVTFKTINDFGGVTPAITRSFTF
ncbi:hypothetical protein C1N56_02515 [Pantoea sp. SGAir0175]